MHANITLMERIGRYRIIGELGRGAMGVVYHATDPAIGRSVAIKIIRIRDINDTQHRDRLRESLFREARSAGVLSHPNIVTIYDMDEVDGLAYIAMAYVNGPTLEKILASSSPLSGPSALRLLRQAAEALDYAHGKGIVHRDVKPANIMTDEDGAVKITDFGIAKITAAGNVTETMTVVGTPNYMSPEQVQAFTVDGRSDQFSLAVISYEILTGERPFPGEHLSTVVYKIVAEQPPEAHRINATLTAQIDEVLRRGLSKKPEDRYPNCASFVSALEIACAESRGWTTLPQGAAAAMPTIAVDRPRRREFDALPARPETTGTRAHRTPLLLPLTMSVIVVLGVAGVITWQAGLMPGRASSDVKPQPEKKPPAAETPRVESNAEQPVPVQPPADGVVPDLDTIPRKPSPLAPHFDPPASPTDEPEVTVKIPFARPHDVWVTTNPPGAKAVLDDNVADACQTPCMLHGSTGTHHVIASQPGYRTETREIHIGDTAQDLPVITLRQPGGTLMLTTDPPGASIRVNGQLVQQITPAQITLPPGNYSITVEKAGKSQSQRIEMQDSLMYLRIPLGQ